MRPTLFAIPPSDPRWLLPAGDARVAAHAFEMYMPSRVGPRALTHILPAAQRLLGVRLLRSVGGECPRELGLLLDLAAEDSSRFGGAGWDSWVAWTGSPGPRRKLSIAFFRDGSPIGYCKVGATPTAREALRREGSVLADLAGSTIAAHVPSLLAVVEHDEVTSIFLAPLIGPKLPNSAPGDERHLAFLSVMAERSVSNVAAFVSSLRVRLERTQKPWRLIVKDLVRQVENGPLPEAPLRYSHGDFAPWNCIGGPMLHVVDWETGGFRPFGFDVFHYATQIEVHVARRRPRRAAARIAEVVNGDLLSRTGLRASVTATEVSERRALLALYLADTLLALDEGQLAPSRRAIEIRVAAARYLASELPCRGRFGGFSPSPAARAQPSDLVGAGEQ